MRLLAVIAAIAALVSLSFPGHAAAQDDPHAPYSSICSNSPIPCPDHNGNVGNVR